MSECRERSSGRRMRARSFLFHLKFANNWARRNESGRSVQIAILMSYYSSCRAFQDLKSIANLFLFFLSIEDKFFFQTSHSQTTSKLVHNTEEKTQTLITQSTLKSVHIREKRMQTSITQLTSQLV